MNFQHERVNHDIIITVAPVFIVHLQNKKLFFITSVSVRCQISPGISDACSADCFSLLNNFFKIHAYTFNKDRKISAQSRHQKKTLNEKQVSEQLNE